MANISGGPPGATPAPGWYPDPWVPGQARWWDGHAWTSSIGAAPGSGPTGAPRPAPPGAPPPPAPHLVADPLRDLDEERRAGRSASVGLIVGAAAYIATFIAIAILYHSFFHRFMDQIHEASRASAAGRAGRSSTVTPQPFGGPGWLVGSGVMQLAQVVLLIVGVLFLVWIHRATQLAEAAGLHPRRTPGMTVAGFIIPIVNYWWPYQSTCDLFVLGDPRRRLVGRWWALWICTQLFSLSLFIASFGPAIVSAILVVIGAGVAVLAAISARAVIAAVGDAHGEIIARATGTAVPTR